VLAQEARLQESKLDATLAFIRANRLNKIITSGAQRKDWRDHGRQILSRRASGVG